MNSRRTRRTIFILSVAVALCMFALSFVLHTHTVVAAAEKAIKKDDARKLIAAVSIFELDKQAVTIKEISPPGAAGANVLASVKLGFRFVKDGAGSWRVADVRTGERQWESFELMSRAFGNENISPVRAELDALAAELDALGKTKNKKASGASENTAAKETQKEPPAKELKRGALTVKEPAAALAPLGSSAVVEVEVDVSVDFVRDARGRWQVARLRPATGSIVRSFEDFDSVERALNTEKLARARADLETLVAALEAYRRARGFYVVADSATTLVDHLNPRYTAAFIRFDPWHRPYEYEGTRATFTLRSLGADGKVNTPDDVTVGK